MRKEKGWRSSQNQDKTWCLCYFCICFQDKHLPTKELAMEALEAQSKFKEKCKLSKPTISLRHEILSPAQPPKVPRTSGYLDFWLENKWKNIYKLIIDESLWDQRFLGPLVLYSFDRLQGSGYIHIASLTKGPHSRVKKGEGSGVAW